MGEPLKNAPHGEAVPPTRARPGLASSCCGSESGSSRRASRCCCCGGRLNVRSPNGAARPCRDWDALNLGEQPASGGYWIARLKRAMTAAGVKPGYRAPSRLMRVW